MFAVLLAARDPRVRRVVALSPVVDWTQDSKVEPIPKLARFTKEAFGMGYRTNRQAWNKIVGGRFYNPAYEKDSIPGNIVLIFHAQDDVFAPYPPTELFATEIGAKLITLKEGGHLSLSDSMQPKFWRAISTFLK